jgi:nitroimidazol reductase NimA-like FMN-containing flavoprotein (pyridoxamine 5'-phosphate oxidase superfamily)
LSVEPDTKTNRRAGFRELRALDQDEIRVFLDRHWWGVLSTVEEPYPYAVPVVYGYDGEYFYVANKSGRKVSNIEANRGVCLCVADVERGAEWSSVVATGDAEFVGSGDGRLAALRALRSQTGFDVEVGPRDVARLAAARVIRIVPHEITGRTTVGR